ncbi:DUF2236 domain-containing protein [Acinetobacter defluvii]|uniref:DUF2236 domain-containing protein n=1 Tax=Acinetobacter defluvii TaxID=1871111 RepID=A0A2S2FH39_9GAMM|nr:oxygenase MpaB family protein [Acinetobacter defluvii]AWL30291.1 DUF2236 domain-containing protein [Acinetobacter defluvii]
MKSLTLPKRLASFEKMTQSSLKSKVFSYLTNQKLQPTYTEYLRLNTALQTGDVTMDEVMQWVMSNPRQNRKLFETALYQGLDQLPYEVPVLTQFFHHIEQTPSWLDKSKLETAIRFTHRLGSNGTFILRDVALMSGYQYPGFNQPLIMTGALSQYAGKRLAETYKWWLDITQANSFERFNLGFTSTVYVRFVHALVRYQLSKSKDWDTSFWGVPINQYDQAMTNIAFSAVLLLGVRAIGIFPSKAESEAIMHFWKYTGWLMGIDEQWLVEKESEAWKLLIWMDYAHPKTDESSRALAKSLSKEPFERHYKYFNNFMQKKAYKNHLEITQFFIGQNKMKNLGLKPRTIAWYPFYLMAKNTLLYNSAKHSDKFSQYLQKHGRSEQEYSLALYQNWGKQLASMHQ